MELLCFPLMGTKSQRCMTRRFKRNGRTFGKVYHYVPQRRLVLRLAEQLSLSESQVYQQVFSERLQILQDLYGLEITKADI
jgi:hypothetical protein